MSDSSAKAARPRVRESSSTARIFSPIDSAAGFAGGDYLDFLGAENGCKPLHLRGLAAAVKPFEGDEFSSLRHARIITFAPPALMAVKCQNV